VVAIVPLGIVHHIDHVPHGDHAGWPFRPEVTAIGPDHVHNLVHVESPVLGFAAAVLAVLLTILIIMAFVVAIRDARRH
jgi:hypothetical protein